MELLTLSGAWIWDKYGKEIVDKAVEKAKKQWVSFNWPRAANTYRERMGKLHGTVRVLGKAEPTTLEEVFTDVFILDQPVAFQRHNIEQLEANPDAPQTKRTSGLKAIGNTKNHKLFILGKPGAGKTTFLKHLVLLTVQGKVKKIPIFVPLMEWSDSQLDVMTFIVQQFDLCHFSEAQLFIETMLKRGDAILLFDGLDEVSQRNEHYSQVITELNNFCKKYLDNPCLITCRNAATNYQFEQFTYVEVADFNDQQQQIFVKKWFEDNSLKRDRFLEEIGRPENRGLKELARTPLLLNMLCLAFGETIAFPARRVEIYEEALDALLKKWDASRNIRRNEAYNKLTLGRKKQLFAELAITSFAQDEYFIHQNVLQDQIVTYLEKLPPADGQSDLDGEAILKTIEAQHGILVERAQHIYSFAHLTFQEYFTARYIVDNATSGTFNQLIETWLTNSNWHDVFLLTASMLHNADDLLKLFKEGVDRLVQQPD